MVGVGLGLSDFGVDVRFLAEGALPSSSSAMLVSLFQCSGHFAVVTYGQQIGEGTRAVFGENIFLFHGASQVSGGLFGGNFTELWGWLGAGCWFRNGWHVGRRERARFEEAVAEIGYLRADDGRNAAAQKNQLVGCELHEFLRQQERAALFRYRFRPVGEQTVDRQRFGDAILPDIAQPIGQIVRYPQFLGRECHFDTAIGDDFIGDMLAVNAAQLGT